MFIYRRLVLITVLLLVVFALPSVASSEVQVKAKPFDQSLAQQRIASGRTGQAKAEENFVEGEVLVKFKKSEVDLNQPQGIASAAALADARELSEKTQLKEQNVLLLKSKVKNTAQLIDELKADPTVEYAEPNYIEHIFTTPNDTSFGQLWGLHNTGQTVNGTAGTLDADMDAPDAWTIETGSSSVTVAVIDSGIAQNHPDLHASVVSGYDFVDLDSTPEDQNGHGTHVAGTIGAIGNNATGVVGVNWTVKIMPLRVFDENGSGTTSDFAAAINYAVAQGITIANYSGGGSGYSQTSYDAISDARDAGLLLMAAAGNAATDNDGGTHAYPSDYDLDNIISVAATDQNDDLASFSNYGTTSVDVAAPGVNIYSSVPYRYIDETFTEAATPNFTNTVFSESGSNSYWLTAATVGGDIKAWADSASEPYQNNANGYITSEAMDASAQSTVILQYDYAVEAEYEADCLYDYLSVQVYDGGSWEEVEYYCGDLDYGENTIDITQYKNANLRVRFQWVTDASGNNYYGAYVDNVRIIYPQAANGSYDYFQGTSMATPQVTGLAALLKANNSGYSYLGLRNAILDNADYKSSLNGLIATESRINAAASLQYVDDDAPTATISYSTTDPTNEDVTATLVPDETVTVTNNSGSTAYTFTENGSFTFQFTDLAGNPGSAIATVSNIDKTVAVVAISYSTTEPISGDVVATLTSDETITITNNLGSNSYTFTENGSFIFEYADLAGNSGTATATVSNIDKEVTQAPTLYYIYNGRSGSSSLVDPDAVDQAVRRPYFEWTGAEDANGLQGYYVNFSTDVYADAISGTFQTANTYAAPRLTTHGTYYLHVKAVDNLSNVSDGVYLTYIFNPAVRIITGTKKGGGPEVRVFDSSGKFLKSFNAYSDSFRGGINVATGDVNGDGDTEIVTSTREGGIPTIKVFNENGDNLGLDFDAYDSKFRGGINIAVGDIEGDGPAEIAVAPISGGSPNVRIFGLRSGKIVAVSENFYAYDKNFRGGIAISIGDIEGDGIGDIVTTPTSKGGPHIRTFGVRNKKYVPVSLGIMAYAPNFRGGINSCMGDVNGDGRDEIMTGIVSAGGPHVRIFGLGKNKTVTLINPGFMAYSPNFRGGISVSSVDIDGDGVSEIITGVGSDSSPAVRIFDQTGKQVAKEFNAYAASYKSGVTVAAGDF
ncbi:MAG: S8 family serine peptidase [Patescibacteria group bacterium]|nr:S8 family serine peptidase [Patescibacteria group bacterium]